MQFLGSGKFPFGLALSRAAVLLLEKLPISDPQQAKSWGPSWSRLMESVSPGRLSGKALGTRARPRLSSQAWFLVLPLIRVACSLIKSLHLLRYGKTTFASRCRCNEPLCEVLALRPPHRRPSNL